MSTTYTFRAETVMDILALISWSKERGDSEVGKKAERCVVTLDIIPGGGVTAGAMCELTIDMTLIQLQRAMEKVPDGHRMAETVFYADSRRL